MNELNPKCLLVLLLIFTCFVGFSQHRIWDKHQSKFESLNTRSAAIPLSSTAQKDASLTGFKDYELLVINADVRNELYNSKQESLVLNIPYQGANLNLLLIKNDIYTSETSFRHGDGTTFSNQVDKGVHYYGVLGNNPNSLVSLSIYANEIVGLISQNKRQLTIAKQDNKDTYIIYKTKDVINPPSFSCDTDDEEHLMGNSNDKVVNNVNNCVNMYVEVDNDIYNNYGSTTATSNYITAVFNQVSTLYANESIDLNISELVIWNTTDPYTGTSTSNYLNQFRNYLNGNYNGDLAHLVGFNGGGGVAYLDVLCNSYYGVGYSAITTNYNTVPSYSWTVEVLTHEIGHNLGSNHTHACAWNGNNTAIDGCGPAAGYSEGCDAPLPSSGTIMSYCHLVGGVGIDFNLGFGPQPGDRIRSEVYNATCLAPCSSGCTAGDTCDDGDACTVGETYDAECNCAGGIYQDSDNDGVCDAEDQCPNMDDNLIGTACNDGDACTINDIYQADCNCAGTYTDNDNDGYCVGNDANDNDACIPDDSAAPCNSDCILEDYQGFESGWGIWNDGGSDVARVLSSTYSTGSYSIRLRDNSGVASATTTDNLMMAAYESIEVAFSYHPVSMENTEDFFLEVSTNNGASFDIVASWVRGTDFDNNNEYLETVMISGYTLTNQTQLRFRCDASGNSDWIYLDEVNIYGCGTSDGCTTVGNSCEDGDDCTVGETIDANCNCTGGIYQDSDNDGVCNADDLCPGMDDDLIGTACNDGDNCTINDTYQSNCTCAGTYEDADGDGFCIGNDPNDNDPCTPDDSDPACNGGGDPCLDVDFESFEAGWGLWNDGGSDCNRATNANAPNGNSSIRLRDNSGASSSMYTDNLDLTGYNSFTISFLFKATNFANGEDFFLEYSTNGGGSYSQAAEYNKGTEFENNIVYTVSTSISNVSLTSSTRFRIRCDASSNSDILFVDDVSIEVCGAAGMPSAIHGGEEDQEVTDINTDQEILVYPNPLTRGNELVIELSTTSADLRISLYNLQGQEVFTQISESNGSRIMVPTYDLEAGAYICVIQSGSQTWTKKLIVQ